MNSKWPSFIVISSLILFAALSRVIPHPPNFAPVGAMALFAGAFYTDKKWAFIFPIIAMLISDMIIGFHSLMLLIYFSFIVIVFVGFKLRENKRPLSLITAGLVSSILFFLISNFGVWIIGGGVIYPINFQGLIMCYIAAIPFFQNTLLGDLFYVGVLFGAFELIKYKSASLKSV